MFKSIIILFSLYFGCLLAQMNVVDHRFGNRLPQPSHLTSSYNNHPSNVNANNNNAGDLVDEFGQCGGLDWDGPKTCRGNLICFKRSKYYAQCLTAEATAQATKPTPQLIPEGGKCHGGNLRGPIACAIGSACFIQTENIHGECKTYCPQGWFCTRQTLPEWAPCGGEGYVGLTKCKEGLQCIAHSKWYHECRSECPAGWKC